ncbi:prolipoprotein diacylglyceryl transferase [Shouchella clausii]|uniref:prolipoprotein diacylglyceryl transferase n=1 Tax=Shouchella clausii TaxID=79880 RepID=UPI000BA7A87F|nr:prolipoprotein diacylglyceryl transferase [Shouchella clausii]MCZ1181888.1 prolipoprotein diacylglyceryl transferase [Shouchella clausii]PAF09291.1 prolipoprotein diacylglyceryl transferase [Shouchella clausii]
MEEQIEPIDRVFVQLGPIAIYWYAVLILLGVAIGYLMARRESVKRGLPQETFADLLVWALPISILSARAYYVIFRWEQFADNPISVFYLREGGIAIHGALIGAVITAIVFAKKRGLSFWKIADVAAPSILIGQAIGRWGNFVNQEVYGAEVTREFLEGMFLPDWIINQMYINGTYYQPTFLYESLWNVLGVVVLLLLRKANLRQGELFLSYVIWYSVGRFVIEGMRLDYLLIGDSLRTAQLLSIILVVAAIALWVYRRLWVKPPRYLNPDAATKQRK